MVTVNCYQRITVSKSLHSGVLFGNVELRARKSLRVLGHSLCWWTWRSNMNVSISLIKI